ncbi:hypothetical protein H7U32_00920 [Bifidobacterium pullorum subsp. saeculare]|uniref:Uncharacterized protein n=1 Tax=Bifidobacterium pullorum subsp. saeculare TaxID=78257 RepID=A0A939B7J4_9BIFI|nr:hypothetical protein [Bifidobacterium pullorum]MBM6698912.1 hypothetical protein [Bifidobacterium pullorum subsp. saeculare]
MADDTKDPLDGLDPDDAHFTDEDLDRAMADFEKEFHAGDASDAAAIPDDAGDLPNIGDVEIPADASAIDASVGFEDELQGLLGNKAKVAVLVTRIASAELLAAFCQLADISAECLGSNQGACAVLRNLDGDGPEAAARDLTTVVNGMSLILAVNRADKLEATLYMHGKAGQTIAPPILFTSTPRFVEDLTLGIVNIAQLRTEGFETVDSASLSHDEAMEVLARHTRFGRGGATKGSRVE